MSALMPMATYALAVPSGDMVVSAGTEIPSAFRITMAAIDPSAKPDGAEGAAPRATLKILRRPLELWDDDEDEDDEDDDEEDFDADMMEKMLAGELVDGDDEDDEDEDEEDDEDDEDDEELNGGPSDPSKGKKARTEAAIKKLIGDGMDVDGDDQEVKLNGVNGVAKSAKAKGKMPAGDLEEDDEDDEEDDDDIDIDDLEGEIEEFVLCTLDPEKNYQQPLDIVIGDNEPVWFKVSGTHTIYLTGNYVEPAQDNSGMYDPDDDEDEEYDLDPDEDELEDDEDEEEDELDDMADPRIMELDEEDEDDEIDVPELVKVATKAAAPKADKKTNKKRPAEDDEEPQTLDEMIQQESAKADEPKAEEPKLSKKQLKKLKKNDGTAAKVESADKPAEVPSSQKSDKKVSFAKELEQGPTPTKEKTATANKTAEKEKTKASLGVKTVQGVTIDDRKLGEGQAAKAGDRVGMRYIGKLANGKVFDSNKKGKPFSFKLGAGDVIKGWDIGIQGMSVGGERRVTIPAHLAYGAKGAGKDIPPNSVLTFDVKLIELNKGK
ncbi:hypothetical protein BAUCODRAFT_123299 [Baudoinia panamericana UAMH 10762]|uniref:peptidylprolyl isomerase n=1 Tax=Baudoinia panamericana (strain UAMH 10762) TaxID=717646 RepID=M2MWW7_BAUPA|nr:uncharacterized protein BAUCODRAFT_123299 [Baudoinia panamericana UAMH 10762]EMC96023.1 hypothetical protein BAUCODRAFT_123299 [Baudoinia panamericana UAMH 10762]